MANHLYWRIRVTENHGSESWMEIAEVEMRATAGGADQCSGGTATASASASGGAAAVFDDNLTRPWVVDASSLPAWVRYQFAAPVDVQEITVRSSSSKDRAPRTFTLEHSDDGAAWTVVGSFYYPYWTASGAETITLGVYEGNSFKMSQLSMSVARETAEGSARLHQAYVSVLRKNGAESSAVVRPQVFVCT